MQITIARNLHGPKFGLGLTNSRILLKSERLREHWKTINGIRVNADRRVIFIELWKPSFPKRKTITNLYSRSSR